jgi:hypothetical protein
VIGAGLGLVLTLMIFSYVLGDNPLFRIAVYLFIGAAAGYAVVVAVQNVLIPQLIAPILALSTGEVEPGTLGVLGMSWVLALLLLLKLNPGNAVGRFPLALLAGVGAAVAVGGAITGTLLPQTSATLFVIQFNNLELLATNTIIVIGVICTLLAFHYGVRYDGKPGQPAVIRLITPAGQVFVGIAFGVMYAGLIAGAAAALTERLGAFWALLGG